MARIKEKKRNLMKDLGGKALWTLEKLIAKTSKVDNTPFFEADLFEWARDLEANHPLFNER